MIPLTTCESSQIAGHGYDPKARTLALQFKTGAGKPGEIYHYENVSPEQYAAFVSAPSKGRHFAMHIKSQPKKHPHSKQGGLRP